MTFPRMRLSTRALMLAIAALGIALGVSVAAQKRKYVRAAARPWWPIEPDPPPPEPDRQGIYWTERGEYGRALAAYEEAIQINRWDFSSLNDLAWILATCPEASLRDGKRAVDLGTKVCVLSEWRLFGKGYPNILVSGSCSLRRAWEGFR